MKEFDENQAVIAMREALAESGVAAEKLNELDDDEILNIIDIIWDFYEQNGLLEIDANPDADADDPETLISDITDYALRMLKKDRAARIDPTMVPTLIRAEIRYEDSLFNA